jgi:hypothetical protein
VDRNLVSARVPPDLPPFGAAIVEALTRQGAGSVVPHGPAPALASR